MSKTVLNFTQTKVANADCLLRIKVTRKEALRLVASLVNRLDRAGEFAWEDDPVNFWLCGEVRRDAEEDAGLEITSDEATGKDGE